MGEGKKDGINPGGIHSVRFGRIWIAAGLVIGLILPVILWIALHRFLWPLVIIGALLLLAFPAVSAIEKNRDGGPAAGYEKNLAETIRYDPDTQYAVIRSSICTGEKVAGFKNKTDGHFTEVMLIRSSKDEQRFRELYGLDSVRTEY